MEPMLDRRDGAPIRRLATALIFALALPQAALAVDTIKRAPLVGPSPVPKSNVIKAGQDFAVLLINPRQITIDPFAGPATRTLRVNFETYAPNRKVKAAVQYSGGQTIPDIDCGTYSQAGHHVCEIKLPNIPRDTKSVKVGMASMKPDAPSRVVETVLTFDVPVTVTHMRLPARRSGNGALPQTNPAIAPQNSGAGSTQALNPQPIPPRIPAAGDRNALNPQPIPPLGDRNALNPQPIPPVQGAVTPVRNPGDPAPLTRSGDPQALNPQPIPPRIPAAGDRNALNPQPIPPGRTSRIPIRNPGDPAPLTREGGAQQ